MRALEKTIKKLMGENICVYEKQGRGKGGRKKERALWSR